MEEPLDDDYELVVDQDSDEYIEPEDEFDGGRPRELQNEDFSLSATDGITLYAKGCSVVLFYGKGPLSKELLQIWIRSADEYAGVNFLTVNTLARVNIMKRFIQLRLSPNHMFHKFTKRPVPFILVYRESNEPGISYPQMFYSPQPTLRDVQGGDFEEEFNDWIETSACLAGFTGEDDEEEPEGEEERDRPRTNEAVERIIRARESQLERMDIDYSPATCSVDTREFDRLPPEHILPGKKSNATRFEGPSIGWIRY